jgi:hypothetical protein
MDLVVETFAVSCVPNKPICKDQNVKGYPIIKFFPPFSLNGTNISPFSLDPHFIMGKMGISEIQEDNNPKDLLVDATKHEKAATRDNNSHFRGRPIHQPNEMAEPIKKKPHFLPRSRTEAFRDAHLSFEFAMKTAVYTSDGPLSQEKQDVLKPFLRILQKTLPATMTIQPILNDMLNNFEILVQGDDKLNAILERYPAPIKTWSDSSRQHGTGYTAGLWTLFHIMSVGLVEWNQMVLDDSQLLVPSEVADHLRSYIEHFFQCDVCRLHFMNEYDACSYDRCNRLISKRKGTLEQYMQFPLWLYETHNAVNTRLRKERIALNDEPESRTTEAEVMWPPMESCSSCWVSEGHWDEHVIFKFLHSSYWYVWSCVGRFFLSLDRSYHDTIFSVSIRFLGLKTIQRWHDRYRRSSIMSTDHWTEQKNKESKYQEHCLVFSHSLQSCWYFGNENDNSIRRDGAKGENHFDIL